MTDRLWDHQWDAIAAAGRAIATGADAGLWVIPTGGGKTRAFLTLARELGWPVAVVSASLFALVGAVLWLWIRVEPLPNESRPPGP